MVEFRPELRFAEHAVDADTHVNLSAVRSDGDHLWIAGDETATVELLRAEPGGYGGHVTFRLADLVALPGARDAEVDVEGLARAGRYLWAVGSHSARRKRVKRKHGEGKAIRRLATVTQEPDRRVLARLAVDTDETGRPTLVSTARDGATSAVLPGGVTPLIATDRHLAPFLEIPGKDNGLDIEGIAVHGETGSEWVHLGLRGPVLRGWAVVLGIRPAEGATPGVLEPAPLHGDTRYRTVFLDLDGLGVRDLCPDGDDLLVLAGPSMDLDGPVRVYRWRDAGDPDGPRLVRAPQLQPELDLDFGAGDDHAEGIALLDGRRLLVVHDSPAPWRLAQRGSVLADVVSLAARG